MRRPLLAAIAALSMIGGSSAAMAQSAAPLSVAAHLRANASTEDASAYRGGIIIPTLLVIGVIALVYLLTKDGDPASP